MTRALEVNPSNARAQRELSRFDHGEVKSDDFLTPNSWTRGKNRKFCYELARILERNHCHVYCVSLDKAKADLKTRITDFVNNGFPKGPKHGPFDFPGREGRRGSGPWSGSASGSTLPTS